MNIQPVKVGSSSCADIRLQKRGDGMIRKGIVERFHLEGKRIIIALDQDDEDYNFLYLSVDTKRIQSDSITLSKKKQGTFHFGLGVLKEIIQNLPGDRDKSIGYYYHKKMTDDGQVYFQFKRISPNK